MSLSRAGIKAIVALGLAAFCATPMCADPGTLNALGRLQDGLWELRYREGGKIQRICLRDRWRLIQLQHPDAACDHLVIDDQPTLVSVQYTCKGKGFGRTQIRRESGQLIQLDTQGIAGGLPFQLSAEGRRVGECAP